MTSEGKSQLDRIEEKLDMIIRFFNMDGKTKSSLAIKQEAHEALTKIMERRRKREEKKLQEKKE